jgi:hypothetical protein
MRIIADPGGAVIDYVERFEAARVSGEPVITDGACLSACTLAIGLLPRGQVCEAGCHRPGYHLSSGRGKRLNEWDSPNQSTAEAVQRLTTGCGGSGLGG